MTAMLAWAVARAAASPLPAEPMHSRRDLLMGILLAMASVGMMAIETSAADKHVEKPDSKAAEGTTKKPKAAKATFPSPEVGEVLKGWNGLEWGTTLEQFKAKFPKASKNAFDRWSTGAGEEKLVGISGNSLYGFNKKGELNLVVFEPVEAERATLRDKLIDAGMLREKVKANWQNGGVTFVCTESDIGQFVIVVNAKFADPKPAK